MNWKLKKRKMSLYALFHWLLVIFLLLNCHSVYAHSTIDFHFDAICCLLIILVILLGNEKIPRSSLHIMGIYLLFMIPITITSCQNRMYIFTFIIKYLLFPCAIFIAATQNRSFLENTSKILIKIVYLICAISLFFFLFSTILGVITPSGTLTVNWGIERTSRSYFGLYFETTKGSLFRFENSAIFTEPPIFASIISFVIVLAVFVFNIRLSKLEIMTFYLALLSTFSTTAYIFIAMSVVGLFVHYYEKIKGHRDRSERLLFWFAIIVMLGFSIWLAFLFMKTKMAHGYSFLLRSDDILTAFRVIRDRPLFGVGFGNDTYRSFYQASERIHWSLTGGGGQSSDFAVILASGGIYYMAFYIAGFYGMLKKSKSNMDKILAIGLLLYIFIISRIGATILFLSFVASGCINSNIKIKEKKNGNSKNMYRNIP